MCRFFEEPRETTAIHRLYRGADVRDIGAAHVLALKRLGPFDMFNIAGDYPFMPEDLAELRHDAPAVIRRRLPDVERAFAARGWSLPREIDRVYVSDAARRELGYTPRSGIVELLGVERTS